MHLERISEHASLKGNVLLRHARVVRMFNVDGGNVVRKQQNLITKKLVRILARQLFSRNELLILQQVHHKGARARERIEDAHALIGQALPELLP